MPAPIWMAIADEAERQPIQTHRSKQMLAAHCRELKTGLTHGKFCPWLLAASMLACARSYGLGYTAPREGDVHGDFPAQTLRIHHCCNNWHS